MRQPADVMARLRELQEVLESLEVVAQELKNTCDVDTAAGFSLYCACEAVEHEIGHASGRVYDHLSQTRRYLHDCVA